MTTELVELADCPCCDSAASVQKEHGRDCSYTWIACTQCPIRTRLHAWMGDDDSIIASLTAAWNTRALASRAAVPDGFVLVPREPTPKMIAAALIARDERIKANAVANGGMYKIGDNAPGDTMAGTYRAMLAAAPEPVAVGSSNSTNDEESV